MVDEGISFETYISSLSLSVAFLLRMGRSMSGCVDAVRETVLDPTTLKIILFCYDRITVWDGVSRELVC